MAEPATEKQTENRKIQPKKPVIGNFTHLYVHISYCVSYMI